MIRAVTSCAAQVSPAPTTYTASAAMVARPSGWSRRPPANLVLMACAPMAGAKPPLSISPVVAASTLIRRRSGLIVIWRLGRCAVLWQRIDRADRSPSSRTSLLARSDQALLQAGGGRGTSHASYGRLALAPYGLPRLSSRS